MKKTGFFLSCVFVLGLGFSFTSYADEVAENKSQTHKVQKEEESSQKVRVLKKTRINCHGARCNRRYVLKDKADRPIKGKKVRRKRLSAPGPR